MKQRSAYLTADRAAVYSLQTFLGPGLIFQLVMIHVFPEIPLS